MSFTKASYATEAKEKADLARAKASRERATQQSSSDDSHLMPGLPTWIVLGSFSSNNGSSDSGSCGWSDGDSSGGGSDSGSSGGD